MCVCVLVCKCVWAVDIDSSSGRSSKGKCVCVALLIGAGDGQLALLGEVMQVCGRGGCRVVSEGQTGQRTKHFLRLPPCTSLLPLPPLTLLTSVSFSLLGITMGLSMLTHKQLSTTLSYPGESVCMCAHKRVHVCLCYDLVCPPLLSSLFANRAACFLKKRDYHCCVEDCHRVRGAWWGGESGSVNKQHKTVTQTLFAEPHPPIPSLSPTHLSLR